MPVMLLLLFLLLLPASVYAFVVVNQCGASSEYVSAINSYLRDAYEAYSRDVRTPALCPDFTVVLKNDVQYPAVTYIRVSPMGACAYRIELRCDISLGWLRHLAYHEMAHALQASFGWRYGWWSEAHAEGLASYYIARGRWQHYGCV